MELQLNRAIFFAGGLRFELEAETADDLQTLSAELAVSAPKIAENLGAVVAAGLAVEAFKKDTSGRQNDRPPVASGTQPGKSDIPNCACGIPMNDARGKRYVKGANEGKLYPYEFYKGKDCKANCDPKGKQT